MRADILLFVLPVFGAYGVNTVSGECNTSTVLLQYNQLGQSFDVYVNGYDVYYKAGQALKGSPENEYVFRTSYVDAYIIPFTQGVGVETLQFQIKLSSSVRVRGFQYGSYSPAYDKNLTTGGNGWELQTEVFNIGLSNVAEIVISWTSSGSELGLRKVAISACKTEQCVPDKTVKTNPGLSPPTGFTIDIPGLAGNTNPVAVLKGSESQVLLSIDPRYENFIIITSPTAFNVKDLSIEIKNGKGIFVSAFYDIYGDNWLFYKQKMITDVSNWVSLGIRSLIGQIINVRRIDIHFMYDENNIYQKVSARNLILNTCQ